VTVIHLDDFRPGDGEDRRARIWAKVMSRVVIHLPRGGQETGCWEWLGPDSGKPGRGQDKGRGHSYGRMALDGATMAVHIVMWVLVNGPIPPRKQLDHAGGCWTRKCCNPSHLEMVTHKRNQRRRDERRKLECVAA
jgi:hypothetical protein